MEWLQLSSEFISWSLITRYLVATVPAVTTVACGGGGCDWWLPQQTFFKCVHYKTVSIKSSCLLLNIMRTLQMLRRSLQMRSRMCLHNTHPDFSEVILVNIVRIIIEFLWYSLACYSAHSWNGHGFWSKFVIVGQKISEIELCCFE